MSPVVLGGGVSVVVGGWLVWEGGVSLLTEVEDEGHPTPSNAHKSPVVLGGGVLVVEGGWLDWGGSLVEGDWLD